MKVTRDADGFAAWLKSPKKRLRWYAAIAIPLISGLAQAKSLTAQLPVILKDWFAAYSAAIPPALNCVLVLVLLTRLIRPHLDDDRLKRATQAVEQFHRFWTLAWFTWLILYALVTLQAVLKASRPDLLTEASWPLWPVFVNSISNVQTASIYCCYLIMATPTVGADSAPLSGRWALPFSVVFLSFIVHLCAVLIDKDNASVNVPFFAISGVAAALSMSLLVGRLDSKLLGTPTWLLVLLYLYAALQPLVLLLSDPLRNALITFALLPKLALFGVFYWFLSTGRSLFYFSTMESLSNRVSDEWQNFRDILLEPGRTFEQSGNVPISETPTMNGSGASHKWDLFLSVPMASLTGDELRKMLKDVDRVRETIEGEFSLRAFYAARGVKSKADFDLEDMSLEQDLAELRASKCFAMVYPKSVGSSVLVEAGAAIAFGKPSVYFVHKQARLPFLLQGATGSKRPQTRIVRFDSYDDLVGQIRKNWRNLFFRA